MHHAHPLRHKSSWQSSFDKTITFREATPFAFTNATTFCGAAWSPAFSWVWISAAVMGTGRCMGSVILHHTHAKYSQRVASRHEYSAGFPVLSILPTALPETWLNSCCRW